MIVTKRVEGEVEFNDGDFAEVQTYGIEGIEKDLLLKTVQIHRQDTDDTSDEFQKRLPVGTVLEITTTTELTTKLEAPVDAEVLRTAVSGSSELNWNMSKPESNPNSEAIVYFLISPLESPGYRIWDDDDLQALGGVHALERHLEKQSYWFARMGQISLNLNPDGATFQDSDLAKLPEPLENEWKIGRLNPSFGQSEIQKQAFKEAFQAIQRSLDLWRTNDGTTVEAYALKELKISAPRLVSLTTGLCALKKIHDIVEVTVVKFWYDPLWLSKPVPLDELVLAEYSFKIPLQLQWSADRRLISVRILPIATC